jgi:hypothetical protein
LATPKDQNIWKNVINNIESEELPENGVGPPTMEKISAPKKVRDGNTKVFVQRIKTIVYIYTDRQGKQYGEQSYQNLSTMGETTIFEALNMFKNDPDTKDK